MLYSVVVQSLRTIIFIHKIIFMFVGPYLCDFQFHPLPNYHFMFPGRYCSHITKKIHSMFSGRYWSHIEDFRDFIKRIGGIVRCPSFRKLTNDWISQTLRVYISLLCSRVSFSNFVRYLGVPKDKTSWFWEPGTRPQVPKS